jgi:hypothetical protein
MSTSSPTFSSSRASIGTLCLILGFLCGLFLSQPRARELEPTPGYDPTRNGLLTICGVRPGMSLAEANSALQDSLVSQAGTGKPTWLQRYTYDSDMADAFRGRTLYGNEHLTICVDQSTITDVWGGNLQQGQRRFIVDAQAPERTKVTEPVLLRFLGEPRFEMPTGEKGLHGGEPYTSFYPTYGLAILYSGHLFRDRAWRFHLMAPASPAVPKYYQVATHLRESRAYQAGRATR